MILKLLFVLAVLEVPLLYQLAFLPDLPLAILSTLAPISSVEGVVFPVHLPIAVP